MPTVKLYIGAPIQTTPVDTSSSGHVTVDSTVITVDNSTITVDDETI